MRSTQYHIKSTIQYYLRQRELTTICKVKRILRELPERGNKPRFFLLKSIAQQATDSSVPEQGFLSLFLRDATSRGVAHSQANRPLTVPVARTRTKSSPGSGGSDESANRVAAFAVAEESLFSRSQILCGRCVATAKKKVAVTFMEEPSCNHYKPRFPITDWITLPYRRRNSNSPLFLLLLCLLTFSAAYSLEDGRIA